MDKKIKNYLEEQNEFDIFVTKKHNCSYNKEKMILALQVELNELCNATKVFKYWSVQNPNLDDIYEEYVDCLHCLFSLLSKENNMNMDFSCNKKFLNSDLKSLFNKSEELYKQENMNIIDLFLKTNLEIHTKPLKNLLIENFLVFPFYLNLNIERILQEYELKSQKNYIRQQNNY